MKSLNFEYLDKLSFSLKTSKMVQTLGEYKGKQDLFTHQTPQILETLKAAAIIQSTESSNRMEGITVEPERLKEILQKKNKPQDRPEAEILGYRNVLAKIHTQFETIPISTATILNFHEEMLKGSGIKGGQWKQKDNLIEERLPDGKWRTRFVPTPARETPYYMEETLKTFNRLWEEEKISRLLLIPSFVLDFLCIHPFTDGNGRISRLLTVLLLHKAGYEVTRFISLERIIEDSKESYYATLLKASQNWKEGRHEIQSWWEYFLATLISSYEELEKRIGQIQQSRGAKTALVLNMIENMPSEFGISDLERACPTVGRDMIRVILNRLRKEGRLRMIQAGRKAKWRKVDTSSKQR